MQKFLHACIAVRHSCHTCHAAALTHRIPNSTLSYEFYIADVTRQILLRLDGQAEVTLLKGKSGRVTDLWNGHLQ